MNNVYNEDQTRIIDDYLIPLVFFPSPFFWTIVFVLDECSLYDVSRYDVPRLASSPR